MDAKKFIEDGFNTIKVEFEKELDTRNTPEYKPNIISDTLDNYNNTRTIVFNCPICGKENTQQTKENYWFTPSPECKFCGYKSNGRYTYESQYADDTVIFEYNGKTVMAMVLSSRDVKLDENFIGFTTAWKHEIKNAAIIDANTCQRFKVNNGIYTKTSTLIANLFGHSTPIFIGITSVAGYSYNNNTRNFYYSIDQAFAAKKKTAAAKVQSVPTITEYKLSPSDIVEFKVSVESVDNVTDETTGQIWCTSCNEVFDFKEKPHRTDDGDLVFDITCPNCGKHVTMSKYKLDSRASTPILVVNELSDSFELLAGRADITDTWETRFDIGRAIKIDKADPKPRLFEKAWQSKNWKPIKTDKYGGSFSKIIVSGKDTCNVLKVFANSEYNWYDRDTSVAKYISAVIKNPALASMALQADTAKKFKELFSPYSKETANLAGQTVEEVFGVEDAFLQKYPNIKLEDLKMFRSLDPNISEDILAFMLTNNLNFWSVRKAFTYGISLDEIKNYLEKVNKEQCLKLEQGLSLWTNYLNDLDICNEDTSDPAIRFPRYLHTEYDCAEWRVEKRAEISNGTLIKETADRYRFLNYSVEKKYSIEIVDDDNSTASGFYGLNSTDLKLGKEKVFRAKRMNGVVFAQIHLNYANEPIRITGQNGYALTATEKKWIQPFLDSLAKTA